MVETVLLSDIISLIERKRFDELKASIVKLFPQDIAELIEGLYNGQKGIVFRLLPKDLAIEVFEHLARTEQEKLLFSFSDAQIKETLEEMSPDDRTELLEELPAKIVKKWIALLSHEDRALAHTLLNYPDDSVGRLLTPDFVDLRMGMSAKKAMKRIRRVGLDKETVVLSVCYRRETNAYGSCVVERSRSRPAGDSCQRHLCLMILWRCQPVPIRRKLSMLLKNMIY